VAVLQQVRQEYVGQTDRGGDVDGDLVGEAGEVLTDECAERAESGIVNQTAAVGDVRSAAMTQTEMPWAR
jgi:hypothetical protein